MGAGLYSLQGKTGASAGKFVTENVDVAKHLIKSKLKPAEKAEGKIELQAGEGKVLEIEGKREAYRDMQEPAPYWTHLYPYGL